MLAPQEILRAHPHLTVTSITPFGLDGPWRDKPATEFTLQAWSGAIVGLGRGRPDRPPVHVGGQIGEWLSGVFAAIGTVASRRRSDTTGELVDVSMLEALAMCLTYYPVSFNDQLGRPMRKRRFIPTPGVGAAKDGLVGLGCGTGQQWLDFCAMVGHPEWTEDPKLFLDRTALAPTIDEWISQHTVDEVRDLATAFQIPNAPIANGANAPTLDHFRTREAFVANARDGSTNPRPPYRLTSAQLRPPEPAPALGEHSLDVAPEREPSAPRPHRRCTCAAPVQRAARPGHDVLLGGSAHGPPARPAGRRGDPPGIGQAARWGAPGGRRAADRGAVLGAGADLRRAQHQQEEPDDRPRRSSAGSTSCAASWRPATSSSRTTRRVCSTGSVCDYEELRAIRPDLVMVRMPGFGLDGPWRDLSAFAFVIEDAVRTHVAHGTPGSPSLRAVLRRGSQRGAPRAVRLDARARAP